MAISPYFAHSRANSNPTTSPSSHRRPINDSPTPLSLIQPPSRTKVVSRFFASPNTSKSSNQITDSRREKSCPKQLNSKPRFRGRKKSKPRTQQVDEGVLSRQATKESETDRKEGSNEGSNGSGNDHVALASTGHAKRRNKRKRAETGSGMRDKKAKRRKTASLQVDTSILTEAPTPKPTRRQKKKDFDNEKQTRPCSVKKQCSPPHIELVPEQPPSSTTVPLPSYPTPRRRCSSQLDANAAKMRKPKAPKPSFNPTDYLSPHGFPINSSHFGLIQEALLTHTASDGTGAGNPIWKMIIACCLLNKTAGRTAIPILGKLLDRWKTPQELAEADVYELADFIRPLGLFNIRAARLVEMSNQYLNYPPNPEEIYPSNSIKHYPHTMISHYAGVGRYCLDSFQIFFADRVNNPSESNPGARPTAVWRSVLPEDKELRSYLTWKWSKEGIDWDPLTGEKKPLEDGKIVERKICDTVQAPSS